MTNIAKAVLYVFLMVLGMITTANALSITPDSTPKWTTTGTADLKPNEIANLVGYGGDLVELYKQDHDKLDSEGLGEETGYFSSYYTTTFSMSVDDPSAADIEYVGSGDDPYISGVPIYLYVKDGNADPTGYVFELTIDGIGLDWNGTDILELRNFWDGTDGSDEKGAISHVTIFR